MEFVRLESVAHINPRCPRELDETQSVSFLAMASVSEEGQVLDEETRTLADTKKGYTYFERGDVLLAKITPCFENGKAAYLGNFKHQIGFGSTEFHVIRPIDGKLDPKYLFYLVWNDQFRFYGQKSMTGAAGQKRVSADFLKSFEIPLPPLPEQRRIAAILDKADAIRRKRQQALRLTEDFLRSVFLDMFGDPVLNPKGFDKQPLGELIKLKSGEFLPAKSMNPHGVYPVYGGNGINGKHSEYMFENATIVLGRVGVYCGSVHVTSGKSWITDNALAVSDISDKLCFRYLAEALKFANLNQYSSQSGQPLISGNRIYPVKIIVPPEGLQRKFSIIFEKHLKLNKQVDHMVDPQNELFNSLIQRAFRGEL